MANEGAKRDDGPSSKYRVAVMLRDIQELSSSRGRQAVERVA